MDITLNGLVIGETKLTDTKRYIKILTDTLGTISVVVHGATSMKSKNLAPVRMFTYSSFTLTQRKDSFTLKEGAVIKSFFALGSDPKKLALASYIASVAGYVSSEGEDMKALLSLTLNSLYALSESEKSTELIKAVFELKCAVVIGFSPALIACTHCSSDIAGGGFLFINDGEVVCEKCREKTTVSDYEITFYLPSSIVSAMRYIVYSDIKKVFSFTLPQNELEMLGEICEKYLLNHIETAFPALKVYKSL